MKIDIEFEKFKYENFENIFGDKFKDLMEWEEYLEKISEFYEEEDKEVNNID